MLINKYSFGEMNKETTKAYIAQVERIADYFFHINQDFHYRNLNKKKFNLMFRYLDFSHFFFDKFLNYNMDLFIYIYKKYNKNV
jgi:hypothetical protein